MVLRCRVVWCLSRNEIEVFQIPNPKYNPEEENSAFYVCVIAIKPAVSDLKVIQHRGVRGVKVLNEMPTFDKEDQERKLTLAEEIEELEELEKRLEEEQKEEQKERLKVKAEEGGT